MKSTGLALLTGATTLGLMALGAFALLELPNSEPATETPLTSSDTADVDCTPSQHAVRGSQRIELTFHFCHPDEKPRELTCSIRSVDHLRESENYGAATKSMDEWISKKFLRLLDQKATSLGLGGCLQAETRNNGSFGWKSLCDPSSLSPEEARRIQLLNAWSGGEGRTILNDLRVQFHREHGQILGTKKLEVEYRGIVNRATGSLSDCISALRRLEGEDSRALMALFTRFFQDLHYELLLPKTEADGRKTLGFRVPTAVLVKGSGDCDSKAAAFCAMWRLRPERVLLVLVPGHALVAVQGKPGPGQEFVRRGNRYFILCEVAGPRRLPPGKTTASGSQRYIEIMPATAPARGRGAKRA